MLSPQESHVNQAIVLLTKESNKEHVQLACNKQRKNILVRRIETAERE